MTDYFALLGVPRRPWTDEDDLKARYHALTSEKHPDVAGTPSAHADFAEINRAYQRLSDPWARLKRLMELEGVEPPGRSAEVPPDAAGLFIAVGETRQSVAAFLKKHMAADSPVAKALLANQQFTIQERVEQLIEQLASMEERLLARVREADVLWDTDRPAALARLPALWQELGYVRRWLGMLREDLFRLAGI